MSILNTKYLITFGDIFRNLAIISLLFYVYKNNIKYFIIFLILYMLSSFMIGNYAFSHKLKPRAYSEWFGGFLTFCIFFLSYIKIVE